MSHGLNAVQKAYRVVRSSVVTQAVLARVGFRPVPAQFIIGPLRVRPEHGFLDLEIEAEMTWEQTRRYEYSKLYYGCDARQPFAETNVVCFRLARNGAPQTVRIVLPEQVQASRWVVFRLDVLPYGDGRAKLGRCSLVRRDDPRTDLREAAKLDALKARTRIEVLRSERAQRVELPHYPESLSLEIQPGCNLTCGHCSSHGTPEVHRRHNGLGEMDAALLSRIAQETFPHLTMVNIVGRGEPLMVSDALWNALVGYFRRYRVLFSVVTNGYFVAQRITREVMPWLDTLTISMDGLNPATFAKNRGGASFERVLAGLRHFHALRKELCLPRRPKLCISWTLKKNNIAEFPEFVRFIAPFEPDRFYVRHLLVFREADREQSLLDAAETANRYLAEAYSLFDRYGIQTDCPPLFQLKPGSTHPGLKADESDVPSPGAAGNTSQDSCCIYIHRTGVLLSDGEMVTCGIQHAERAGVLQPGDDFLSLWNGPTMQAVRRDLNTAKEWQQCRDCWFRQSRYYLQRELRAERQAYSMRNIAAFSAKAWDHRGYDD